MENFSFDECKLLTDVIGFVDYQLTLAETLSSLGAKVVAQPFLVKSGSLTPSQMREVLEGLKQLRDSRCPSGLHSQSYDLPFPEQEP